MNRATVLFTAAAFAFAIALLVSCQDTGGKRISTEIVGYNHTNIYIHNFTVDGFGGSNAFPHSGGGTSICCVVIPQKWRPGLKVAIRWMNPDDTWNETTAEIPYYPPNDIGPMNVHFLRDGSVKAFVFNGSPHLPGYPLQGKEATL